VCSDFRKKWDQGSQNWTEAYPRLHPYAKRARGLCGHDSLQVKAA